MNTQALIALAEKHVPNYRPTKANSLASRIWVATDEQLEAFCAALAAAQPKGEKFCNKCGYFGPDEMHNRPRDGKQCDYLSCPVKKADEPVMMFKDKGTFTLAEPVYRHPQKADERGSAEPIYDGMSREDVQEHLSQLSAEDLRLLVTGLLIEKQALKDRCEALARDGSEPGLRHD